MSIGDVEADNMLIDITTLVFKDEKNDRQISLVIMVLYYSIPDDYRIILVESEYIDDVSSEVSSITKSLGF